MGDKHAEVARLGKPTSRLVIQQGTVSDPKSTRSKSCIGAQTIGPERAISPVFFSAPRPNRIVACVGDEVGTSFLRGAGCKPLFLRPKPHSSDVQVVLGVHVNLRHAWVDVGTAADASTAIAGAKPPKPDSSMSSCG